MWFLWILIACHLNQILLPCSCACVVGYPRSRLCYLLFLTKFLGRNRKMSNFWPVQVRTKGFCLIGINEYLIVNFSKVRLTIRMKLIVTSPSCFVLYFRLKFKSADPTLLNITE